MPAVIIGSTEGNVVPSLLTYCRAYNLDAFICVSKRKASGFGINCWKPEHGNFDLKAGIIQLVETLLCV